MVQLVINFAMLQQIVLDTVFVILLDNVLVMQVLLVQTVINVHQVTMVIQVVLIVMPH